MNSLPFLTRLIAATILAKQNKMLIAEVALLRTENAYLRERLPEGHRFTFTDVWRKRFARAAVGVGRNRVGAIVSVAKAGTIRGWHRLLAKGKLGVRRVKAGRPKTDAEIEHVVIRMATENPTWGQKRIQGELRNSDIRLGCRTIGAILNRHGLLPAHERTTDSTWKTFITDKADALVATDFFTVDVVGWLGKTSYDVLFAIHLASRKVAILGVTEHSNEAYMTQTARNATMDGGWLKQVGCRYLIHDGDGKFCDAWKGVLADAKIETVTIPPNSPNCNAFAERWVRTAKRELIRRCWFLSHAELCQALNDFVVHYHEERPHQSLGNRPPTPKPAGQAATQKPIAGFKASDMCCVTRCNGTIRHYYRADRAAA